MTNKTSKGYHAAHMELFGCYTCKTVGGEYSENTDGTVTCEVCGEDTVITFGQALELMLALNELQLLDDYHELVEHFGMLHFDEDDDYDPEDY